MCKRFQLIALLSILLMPLACLRAQAAWQTLVPGDAGFSILAPDTPKLVTTQKPKVISRMWVAKTSGILFLAGVTDYDAHINTETELDLDMKNFLKEVNGTVQSQKRLTFNQTSHEVLPALDFSFVAPSGAGRSLIVVAGDRTYQLVVIGLSHYDAKAETDRILASSKITAPARHWQGP